jgi:hypothetical protein
VSMPSVHILSLSAIGIPARGDENGDI